jgi:hypothetical protein
MKTKKLIEKLNLPSWSTDEIPSKHLLVFCNISARLSRYLVDILASQIFCNNSARLSKYFGDIHAGTAHYRTKLTCSQPVKLLHS